MTSSYDTDYYHFNFQRVFIVLAIAFTGVLADVSHLRNNGITTQIKEDGYHYPKPQIPFPPVSLINSQDAYCVKTKIFF